MTDPIHTLARIAEGIRDRREREPEPEPDKPNATQSLRALMHVDNDASTTLARLKRNAPTPTNEKDTQS